MVANTAFTVTNFRRDLVVSLVEKGVEVVVVCPRACDLAKVDDVTEMIASLGARHVELPFSRSGLNPLAEVGILFRLYKILKVESPTHSLFYTIKPVIYGSIAARLAKIPLIASTVTGIGYVFTSKMLKAKLIGLIVRLQYFVALRCNSIVFFQNPDDRELFRSLGLLNGVDTFIVNGSGVNTDYFSPRASKADKLTFLMICRILKDKGVREYVEAARQVKGHYPDVCFRLMGPLDENPEAIPKSDVMSWEQENLIEYIPATDDVRPMLAACDVFVLPSYREGTPRSVLEAMAMAKPVITTDAPGCRETVEGGVNGYLVPCRDSQSLANAIHRFIDNNELIVSMGEASLEIVRSKYDVKVVNSTILEKINLL